MCTVSLLQDQILILNLWLTLPGSSSESSGGSEVVPKTYQALVLKGAEPTDKLVPDV